MKAKMSNYECDIEWKVEGGKDTLTIKFTNFTIFNVSKQTDRKYVERRLGIERQ